MEKMNKGPVLFCLMILGLAAAARPEIGLSAGIAPSLRLPDGKFDGALLLGVDAWKGPHLFELRHASTFMPVGYMTSVDHSVTLAYGFSPRMPRLHLCAGVGLYEDYRKIGAPLSLRLDWEHLGIESFFQIRAIPEAGFTLTLKTGNLLP